MSRLCLCLVLLLGILLGIGCQPELSYPQLELGKKQEVMEIFCFYYAVEGKKHIPIEDEEVLQLIISDYSWTTPEDVTVEDLRLAILPGKITWKSGSYKITVQGVYVTIKVSMYATSLGVKEISIRLPGMKAVASAVGAKPEDPFADNEFTSVILSPPDTVVLRINVVESK